LAGPMINSAHCAIQWMDFPQRVADRRKRRNKEIAPYGLIPTAELVTVFMPDGKVATSSETDLMNLRMTKELEKR